MSKIWIDGNVVAEDDDVISYADLIEAQEAKLLEDWMAEHGEVIVLSEGEEQ